MDTHTHAPTTPALGKRGTLVYASLVSQTRDAVHAAGFTDVTLGLSGGIDSALTATIAVDALGRECVHGVLMPSEFSSPGSLTDASELARRLDIETFTLPVTPAFESFKETLAPVFGDLPHDVTEENLQARVRGVLLMALSNKFNWFVLATGNMSEALMGYATLYGDMVGSFAPLGPLLKAWVYELARFRNDRAVAEGAHVLIPDEILTKEPSAELSAGQLDRTTLGSYDELDAVLYYYFVLGRTVAELDALGFDAAYVQATLAKVEATKFKRDMACPGASIDGYI
jgi:NAD+ synthase (glutamine-hydrolysing)